MDNIAPMSFRRKLQKSTAVSTLTPRNSRSKPADTAVPVAAVEVEPSHKGCMLVIDTREKNVLRHENELLGMHFVVKQITTGDYAVLSPEGKILVIMERKSLKDFAASLKDGRHENKAKLIQMRNEYGCRIIYIIEGPEFPPPDALFENIPYRNIESSIFHLMVRECITVIRTANTIETARTLVRFIESMNTLYCDANFDDKSIGPPIPLVAAGDDSLAALSRRHEKSDVDVARELWDSFPGISIESADEYMKHWTISEIIQGKIPRKDILNFKLASGRAIGKKAAASLTGITRLIEVRILSRIPGISQSTAAALVNNTPLAALLTYDAAALADQLIKPGRRLGDRGAKNILKYLNYKYQIAPPADTPAPVVPPRAQIDVSLLSDADIQDFISSL